MSRNFVDFWHHLLSFVSETVQNQDFIYPSLFPNLDLLIKQN